MAETVGRLLAWFEANARRLPWRSEPRDPYRVLVSELMLQQTRVDRVVPRFEQFIERFPDLEALAAGDGGRGARCPGPASATTAGREISTGWRGR